MKWTRSVVLAALAAAALVTVRGTAASAATADLGPNVIVFDPSMPAEAVQKRVDQLFTEQETNQFGAGRYTLFFKPGHYRADVRVGFYTQVAGPSPAGPKGCPAGAFRALRTGHSTFCVIFEKLFRYFLSDPSGPSGPFT